jgi:replicative DNA helicase
MVVPHNEQAERAVIGSILCDPVRVLDACHEQHLDSDAFFAPANRTMYEAACELSANGSVVDQVTMTDALTAKGKLELCGGTYALDTLIDETPTAAHAEYYIDLLKRDHLLRKIIHAAETIKTKAHEAENAVELQAEAECLFESLERHEPTEHVEQVWREVEADMEAAMNGAQIDIGLGTGFGQVDAAFGGGLRRGGVYFLSGEKGTGKTTLKCNIINQQLFRGLTVANATLEMTMRQELERLAGPILNTSVTDVLRRPGKVVPNQQAIERAREYMTSGKLRIETRLETTEELRAWGRRMVGKHGADLLCVDSIQLVRAPMQTGAKLFEQVTEASRAVTRMARALNVPVLCVSMESKDGLWGSRQLDYDAYGVLKLRSQDKAEPPDYVKTVTAWVDKSRFGPEHFDIPLTLHGRVGLFKELG